MSVVAVSPTETKTAPAPMNLWMTGFLGGVYVLAALAVVFYAVPQLWEMGVSSWFVPIAGPGINAGFRVTAQLAALVLLTIFGISLSGLHPPHGIRGSIFLGISVIIALFFLVRGALMNFERLGGKFDIGILISLAFIGACLFFIYKFLASDRFTRWSVTLEEAGWFSTDSYKRNQGLRVRRLTIFGVILLFGSGVYTLWHNRIITGSDWIVSLPFAKSSLMLLPNIQLTVPLLLAALTLWLAWRIVNFPVFADFLIATEAEINKVSWTPRVRLIQDTIVVLITTLIITLFLLVVDLFWGWFLSYPLIGVLPSAAETKQPETKQVNSKEF